LLERIRLGRTATTCAFDADTQQVWLGYGSERAGMDRCGGSPRRSPRAPAGASEGFALEPKGAASFANVPPSAACASSTA